MTTSASPAAPAPRRRPALGLAAALVLAGAAAWLFATKDASATQRLLFGRWHARDALIAAALAWTAALLCAEALSRSLFLKVAGATLIAALSLGLIEAIGLLGIVNYARVFGMDSGEVLGSKPLPNADVSGVTWEDAASAWGLRAQGAEFHYKTDRRGYRNDVDRESADVYLLGDSCLVGAMLPFERTLCGRLESVTGRPTTNVALIGIGVQEERDRFLEARLPLNGKLVLQFVFEGNDQSDSANYRARHDGGKAPGGKSSFVSNALLRLQKWTDPVNPVARRRTGLIGDQPYLFYWTAEQFRGKEGEIPFITQALDDVRKSVESAGGRYAVVVIPDKIRVLGPIVKWPPESELSDWRAQCSPLPQAVAEWGARERVPVLDLTDALSKSAATGRIPWFKGDTHWNATGHEVAAQTVAAWMASLGKTEGR